MLGESRKILRTHATTTPPGHTLLSEINKLLVVSLRLIGRALSVRHEDAEKMLVNLTNPKLNLSSVEQV